MSVNNKGLRGKPTGRKSKNTFVTKSGQTIKLHRNLGDRLKAVRDSRARRRAERLAGMPKSRVKRFFYRLQPKRLYKYWFSREGAIMALKITGIGIVAGFVLLVGLFAYFRKDLPNLRDISGTNIGGSVRYFDRTGETLLWQDYDAIKRIPIKDENISQVMKDATIAIEDKDFFHHSGFDVRGISRAAWNNAFGGGGTQGGSTITQQLVKLTQKWSNERTYTRKIKELILAVELERTYSKQEILVGYLNAAPYGNIQYGVEAATRDYFEKSAKDLTLDEAAFLASIPKSPSFYSPYGPIFNPEALVGRMHYVLDLMEQQGKITKAQRDEAKKVDILAKYKEPKQKYAGILAPYFVLAAKEQLEQMRPDGIQVGGWKVTTTLDMNLQKIADEQVQKGMAQVKRQGGDTAAFVAEDVKTGQIVALVGNSVFTPDRDAGQVNFAREKLPPGSSFKPYDYLALIEHHDNFGAGSVLYDTQGPLPGYECTLKGLPPPKGTGNCLHNYDFKYPGPLTLRYALGGSRNVPAVKAMLTTGVDKTIETAEKLGLESGYNCYLDDKLTKEGPCYGSAAIGDGAYLKLDEHVHAFGTISRNGVKLPRTYILKVEDAGNKTILEWKPSAGEQVIRPDAAYIVADMMADPRASYFSQKIHSYKNHKFSVKTGTTNNSKDGLLMGFSTQYAAGVWVGYHNRRVEMTGFMENMTRPIWNGWMQAAHNNLQPEERAKPSGVQTLPAYVVRNHVGTGSIEPSPSNDLYPSWYKQKAISNKKRTIDIVSNKLATDCTPPRARKEVTEDPNAFSGDQFVNQGGAGTSEQTDDIHQCSDFKPSIMLSVSGSQVTAHVTKGTHPLSSDQYPGTVNFVINGQTVHSAQVSDGSPTATYNYTGAGDASVTAVVIDSVLYDATSSSVTVSGTGGEPISSLTITSAKVQGTHTRFKWANQNGTVTIYRVGSNTPVCSGTNDCEVPAATAPAGTKVYAKDTAGNKSADVTVS